MFGLSQFRFLVRGFSTTKRSKVFMDIAVEGEPKGRLVFELFDDLTPKTAENFRKLCVGAGTAKSKDVPLHYKGSSFYRIFEGFMCQGGDFINNDGTGGESIYGPTFHDENKKVQLDKAGVLAMLNKGPDTNNSNFFITFIDCSFLDDKYVGFGQLVDGHPVLNQIEYCGNAANKGQPKKKVEIINCGEIKTAAEQTIQ